MAGEVQFTYRTGATCYFLVRNATGQVWNTSGTGAFVTYDASYYSSYSISCSEQGTGSSYYVGNFPTAIPPGVYPTVAKSQIAGSGVESDPTAAQGDVQYKGYGSGMMGLPDLMQSGIVQTPKLQRQTMVQNFPVYLKSSVDHATPFVSGTVSGQIARDGGTFGPLQSGAITETGMGWYTLQALTSGDLNASTVKLLFTATSTGGGSSDPLPMAFVLQ